MHRISAKKCVTLNLCLKLCNLCMIRNRQKTVSRNRNVPHCPLSTVLKPYRLSVPCNVPCLFYQTCLHSVCIQEETLLLGRCQLASYMTVINSIISNTVCNSTQPDVPRQWFHIMNSGTKPF